MVKCSSGANLAYTDSAMRTIADIALVLNQGFIIKRTNGKGTLIEFYTGTSWTKDREAARLYSESEANSRASALGSHVTAVRTQRLEVAA